MIALIAAVPFETALLRQQLQNASSGATDGFAMAGGTLRDRAVSIIHCGIGKANAAAAAALTLELLQPEAVLCLGIGGAFPASGLRPGDLAIATEEIFGDEGATTPEGFLDMEALGFPLHETGGIRLFNRFPVSGNLARRAADLLRETPPPGRPRQLCGPFVTVSTCSSRTCAALELEERTGGICENMEGAAIAQQCLRYGRPFLEIRGISNLTEDRGLTPWDLRSAARVAQEAALILLEGLSDWN